jgi:hypothetical protein
MRIDCPFKIYVKYEENRGLVVSNVLLKHNHAVNERIFSLYRNSKRLNEYEEAKILQLLDLKTPVNNIVRLLNNEQKNVNAKDIFNLQAKRKQDFVGGRNESELLNEVIEEIRDHRANEVFQQVDEDGVLESVVIVLESGKIWYAQNPDILHIDGTYKTNVENYILFVFLIQNDRLNGLPVAFAFMRHEDNITLEFVYRHVTQVLDPSRVGLVMVDKDLSNIDFINRYYQKAQVYLCTFHVIKYLKVKITMYNLSKAEKATMRSLITQVVYAESEAEYSVIHKQISSFSDKAFVTYWDTNWDNCKNMWMHLYRKDDVPTFGTNTNNHIESFNNIAKNDLKHCQHISTALRNLMLVVGDFIRKQNQAIMLELKVPVSSSAAHSNLLKVLSSFLNSKALDIGIKALQNCKDAPNNSIIFH